MTVTTKRVIKRFAQIINEDLDSTRKRFPADYKRTWDACLYAASTFARTVQDVRGFDYETFMKSCGLRENFPQQ